MIRATQEQRQTLQDAKKVRADLRRANKREKPSSKPTRGREVDRGFLASTAEDLASRVFACHKSSDDHPLVCAGFLLRGASHNLSLRLAYARGEIVPENVTDGGYPLFSGYRDMAVANGVPSDDPALRRVRND